MYRDGHLTYFLVFPVARAATAYAVPGCDECDGDDVPTNRVPSGGDAGAPKDLLRHRPT